MVTVLRVLVSATIHESYSRRGNVSDWPAIEMHCFSFAYVLSQIKVERKGGGGGAPTATARCMSSDCVRLGAASGQ